MSNDLTASIVRILNSDGTTVGTGFVVTENGLVATCAHVVGSDSGVWVVFQRPVRGSKPSDKGTRG